MKAPKFWKKAVFWVAFSLAAGGAASWLTRDGLQRFEQIAKPALTPPRIVFPIAWTILLFLIGYGFALIREKTMGTPQAETASVIFGVQMTFFFCWMIWFFGLGWYGFAALWLLGMIASIILMISFYRKISKTAAWMQVPYLVWCCFALYLNTGVWLLNR
ncbi:MAG: tryptophan-rich sensory protein [Oscillospiraceae bacterium]|nr:tryptophan-rich sensory protein [Oscillospiraceae bacterium]